MKRNRESKYRIKCIQLKHMKKSKQKILDETLKKYNIQYFDMYNIMLLDRNSFHRVVNKMIDVEMVKMFDDMGDFIPNIMDFDFMKNDKPYWMGVDLSAGKDFNVTIKLPKERNVKY